jgi:hypothetical protein
MDGRVELDRGWALRRTTCDDCAIEHRASKMEEGYFAFFTDNDWSSARFRTRDWATCLRVMHIPGYYFVLVPSRGWMTGADNKPPFFHPKAELVCPAHLVDRLRACLDMAKEKEDDDVFLESGFRGRTKELLQVLRERGKSPEALELVKHALLDWGRGVKSPWDSDSKALTLLVKAANKKEDKLKTLFESVMSNQGTSRRERLRRFDALLKFSFGVLRLSRRSEAQCHKILARAFYSHLSNSIRPFELKTLETHNYSKSIDRFITQIKKRLERSKGRRR